MAKASINFKPLKPNSKNHNERLKNYDYIRDDLKDNNDHWKLEVEQTDKSIIPAEIEDRMKEIKKFCKIKTGRALYKNASPIREAVVNIEPHHTMEDLKILADDLKKVRGIDCFQIHIHRDEGRWVDANGVKVDNVPGENASIQPDTAVSWKPNLHAHMLFDWQNKEEEYTYKAKDKKGKEILKTVQIGKTHRLQPLDLVNIQDIVARSLNMERGAQRVNNKAKNKRLEPMAFKLSQDYKILQEQIAILEQKKNTAARANSAARDQNQRAEKENERFEYRIKQIAFNGIELAGYDIKAEANSISEAAKFQERTIEDIKGKLAELKESREYRITWNLNKEIEAEERSLSKQQIEFKNLENEIIATTNRISDNNREIKTFSAAIQAVKANQ